MLLTRMKTCLVLNEKSCGSVGQDGLHGLLTYSVLTLLDVSEQTMLGDKACSPMDGGLLGCCVSWVDDEMRWDWNWDEMEMEMARDGKGLQGWMRRFIPYPKLSLVTNTVRIIRDVSEAVTVCGSSS